MGRAEGRVILGSTRGPFDVHAPTTGDLVDVPNSADPNQEPMVVSFITQRSVNTPPRMVPSRVHARGTARRAPGSGALAYDPGL